MGLRLFNSGSGERELFETIAKGKATMYVCGVTPYDTTHLGHAFTYVSFDVLARYLRWKGIDVTYTENVTDIDDDVLRKGREEVRDWKELGQFWTDRFLTDMRDINVIKPNHYVRATDSIPRIIEMVNSLLKKGVAYRSGKNVYFDVSKFPTYGRLSHFNAKQMALLLKERGGDPEDPNKRNPLDFILWQGWKHGEPYWETPWGRGRPGWHIECSAMINQYLGDRIDIHGGGRDLIFPHHESEIAQSESYTGKKPFARYFMHTAMVMMSGEKMSKSLGNLVLVSDLLKDYSANAIRWLLISHHYRQVWEYTERDMKEAQSRMAAICRAAKKPGKHGLVNKKIVSQFTELMDDDLDTPGVLKLIESVSESGKDAATVSYLLGVLGFTV